MIGFYLFICVRFIDIAPWQRWAGLMGVKVKKVRALNTDEVMRC